MRLVILGAGAIGGSVAAHLAHAGRDVLLLARGAQLAAIRTNGLKIERAELSFVSHPEVGEPRETIAWRDDDVLVVATKTQDVAAALAEVAPPAHVPIACMTNGLEAERIALRHARTVYGVYVSKSATYLVPGVVQVFSSPIPGLFDVGRYPDGIGDHADELVGELIAAGFSAETRPTIMKWKRGKLLSNLANGAEALCGAIVLRSPIIAAAKDEARACFEAANLAAVTEAEDLARRKDYLTKPIAGVPRAGGSTWQSLARGHHTLESDYLNGEIALLGRLHGVPTPVNEALQQIVGEAARAGAQPGAMSVDELAARVAAHTRT